MVDTLSPTLSSMAITPVFASALFGSTPKIKDKEVLTKGFGIAAEEVHAIKKGFQPSREKWTANNYPENLNLHTSFVSKFCSLRSRALRILHTTS